MKMYRSADQFFDEEVNVLTANFLTFPLRELPPLSYRLHYCSHSLKRI
ncbi:hypothetical protein AVEN_134699-2, partial [Araneus ventricosus]